MQILVTGCCGFIGSHISKNLLDKRYVVIGVDNLNNYYDVAVKEKNKALLCEFSNFTFIKDDFCNVNFDHYDIDYVIHLAGYAGVRYSIENPATYFENNIMQSIVLLQKCVKHNVKKFVFASSSSVYGNIKAESFQEDMVCNQMVSPYACSKKCLEELCSTFSNIYGLQTVALRFFTVYGPRGRPDMAPYKFIYNIVNEIPIYMYGDGSSMRDYTYIDDIVNGVIQATFIESSNPFTILNLGNNNPCSLIDFISLCEKVCMKQAIVITKDMHPSDVKYTCANIDKAINEINYKPSISLHEGLTKLHLWITNNKI